MIPHSFYRSLVVVSFIGSVIFAPQVSTAYQLSALQERQDTMTGHIRGIDQTTGIITVETATGIVTLEATPEAIADWKEGDPVVVKIDSSEPREHEEVAVGETTFPQSSPPTKSQAVESR
ncbi:MAG: hypothetical protein HOP18_02515 [Deltaproteobacteria bacterium]|nr:hypothetical protein [Deltaproteobacteria bacterium]